MPASHGPEAPVVYPLEGKEVHYEAELAVVIGRRARWVPPDEALVAILAALPGDVTLQVFVTPT